MYLGFCERAQASDKRRFATLGQGKDDKFVRLRSIPRKNFKIADRLGPRGSDSCRTIIQQPSDDKVTYVGRILSSKRNICPS